MSATAAVQKTPNQTVLDLIRAMETAFDSDDFLSLQSTLPALGSAGTRTLLQHAVHKDCPDVVRVLLTDASVEATINANDDAGMWGIMIAPLLLAAELGRVECLQALLACPHVDIHAVGHDFDSSGYASWICCTAWSPALRARPVGG